MRDFIRAYSSFSLDIEEAQRRETCQKHKHFAPTPRQVDRRYFTYVAVLNGFAILIYLTLSEILVTTINALSGENTRSIDMKVRG